ncbi:MAG TPA: hypothetical protein PLI45_03410 [Candidatus Woesebacteria bacterium]|nr:hypothetical protein [Candidatus Woesebacteria bacterium]
MENIDTIINSQITVSSIVGVLVKLMMLLLLTLSAVMVRQCILMNRVVKLPIGGSVRLLTWSYFVLMLFLTAIVILA